MNKYFIIGFSTFALASCNKERVRGSGAVSTEQRTVSGFTKEEITLQPQLQDQEILP